MKSIRYIFTLLLLASTLMTACSPTGNPVNVPIPSDFNFIEAAHSEATSGDGNLVIWSDIPFGDELIEKFEKANPGTHVEVVEKSLDTELKDYMQAMVDQTAVDIFVMDSTYLGKFSTLQGFEDLSQAPYYAEKYKHEVPVKVWNNHLSVSNDALFALPVGISPVVLYYRADLMERYGFPSEPEKLAIFLESEDNLLALAEGMKSHNHLIFLWDSFMIDLLNSKYGFFDDNFDITIPKEDFINSIALTKEIMKKRYVVNKNIWMPDGEQAIRDGEIVMLTLGSWGEKYLPEIAPDLSGAWKATRMPLDLYGWSSSTALAIPTHSTKKELAWKFLQFTMEQGVDFKKWPVIPANQSTREEAWRREQVNPYFGNQKTYALYEDLMKKTDAHSISPFDDELFLILYESLFQGIEQNVEPEKIYKDFINTVSEKYGEEIDVLRNR